MAGGLKRRVNHVIEFEWDAPAKRKTCHRPGTQYIQQEEHDHPKQPLNNMTSLPFIRLILITSLSRFWGHTPRLHTRRLVSIPESTSDHRAKGIRLL